MSSGPCDGMHSSKNKWDKHEAGWHREMCIHQSLNGKLPSLNRTQSMSHFASASRKSWQTLGTSVKSSRDRTSSGAMQRAFDHHLVSGHSTGHIEIEHGNRLV